MKNKIHIRQRKVNRRLQQQSEKPHYTFIKMMLSPLKTTVPDEVWGANNLFPQTT